MDHVIPLSLGGTHTWHNTQCLCRSCNVSKGAKRLLEGV
ncbi:HNH endonuclease [Dokdonella soli]